MDLERYEEHLPPLVPAEEAPAAARHLLARCPVAHSDQDDGFWIVNRHEDLLEVMQDWRRFETGTRGVYVPTLPVDRPAMAPLETNPPRHRKVKDVLSRFLSPRALERHEDRFREIIGSMIAGFAEEGGCDIAQRLSKRYPAQIITEVLLGVTDPDEVHQLEEWVRLLTYDMTKVEPEVLGAAQAEWRAWCARLLADRRANPGDDVVTSFAQMQADADGEPLSDDEIVGAIQLLLFAGFGTTSDATSNIIIRLIEEPGLQDRLRAHPEDIPAAIEEALRLEPPVTTRPRRAREDVEIGGRLIPEGSRILCNYLAANVDPDYWDDPDAFRLDRTENRAVTFGVGMHRCSGVTMARVELRIMVEELLRHCEDIRWDGDQRETRVSFLATVWRAVDSLPVRFTPARASTGADGLVATEGA